MLNLGFEYWTPADIIDEKYGTPEKNFDIFREQVTILAGFYKTVHNINGTFKVKAKSISFAAMDNDEFEALYNAVLNVLMRKILVGMDKEEVEKLTEQFMNYA